MDFFNWPVVIFLSDCCFLPTTLSGDLTLWRALCTDGRLHEMVFALIYAVGEQNNRLNMIGTSINRPERQAGSRQPGGQAATSGPLCR